MALVDVVDAGRHVPQIIMGKYDDHVLLDNKVNSSQLGDIAKRLMDWDILQVERYFGLLVSGAGPDHDIESSLSRVALGIKLRTAPLKELKGFLDRSLFQLKFGDDERIQFAKQGLPLFLRRSAESREEQRGHK